MSQDFSARYYQKRQRKASKIGSRKTPRTF